MFPSMLVIRVILLRIFSPSFSFVSLFRRGLKDSAFSYLQGATLWFWQITNNLISECVFCYLFKPNFSVSLQPLRPSIVGLWGVFSCKIGACSSGFWSSARWRFLQFHLEFFFFPPHPCRWVKVMELPLDVLLDRRLRLHPPPWWQPRPWPEADPEADPPVWHAGQCHLV